MFKIQVLCVTVHRLLCFTFFIFFPLSFELSKKSRFVLFPVSNHNHCTYSTFTCLVVGVLTNCFHFSDTRKLLRNLLVDKNWYGFGADRWFLASGHWFVEGHSWSLYCKANWRMHVPHATKFVFFTLFSPLCDFFSNQCWILPSSRTICMQIAEYSTLLSALQRHATILPGKWFHKKH